MKDQVTSIEQSRRLLKLGVPAGRASMLWIGDDPKQPDVKSSTDIETAELIGYTPAFTVADLLGMLPAGIAYDRLYITHAYYSGSRDWRIFYKRVGVNKGAIISFGDNGLVEPACAMIEWLLSNGYELKA